MTEVKSIIAISLDTSVVNAIDREREYLKIGRSAYLNDLLRYALIETTDEPDISQKVIA